MKFCVNLTKNLLKILEMFDNLMKVGQVSKKILTNFDKFEQFIKILSGGSFRKNLR